MKKKIIVISIILVLILSAAGIAGYQHHLKKQRYNDSYVNGNTAGNLYNYGMFCEHNGTIYFSNPNDSYRLYSQFKYKRTLQLQLTLKENTNIRYRPIHVCVFDWQLYLLYSL